MKHSWLMIITAVLLLLLNSPASASSTFTDISNHWAQEEIQFLADEGIVNGIGNGLFGPEQQLTKAQWITMLHRTLNLQITHTEPPAINQFFSDVNQDAYYAEKLYDLALSGIVDDRGIFEGSKTINRQLMAHYLRKAHDYYLAGQDSAASSADASKTVPFSDREQIEKKYAEDVSLCLQWGFVKGYPNGNFAPLRGLTRAEGAMIIYRWKQKMEGETSSNPVTFRETAIQTGPNLELIYRAVPVKEGVEVVISYHLPSPAYYGKVEKATVDGGIVTIVIAQKKVDDGNMYSQVVTVEQKTLLLEINGITKIRVLDGNGELIKEIAVTAIQ